jgi:hypothetical protein
MEEDTPRTRYRKQLWSVEHDLVAGNSAYISRCRDSIFPCLFCFVFLRLPLVLFLVSLSLLLVLYIQSLLVVFGFFDFNETSGALSPRKSTAHREGRRISFVWACQTPLTFFLVKFLCWSYDLIFF